MVCDRNVDLLVCTPRSTVTRRLLLLPRKREIATVLEWPVDGRSHKEAQRLRRLAGENSFRLTAIGGAGLRPPLCLRESLAEGRIRSGLSTTTN
jgi:hypothetical protein